MSVSESYVFVSEFFLGHDTFPPPTTYKNLRQRLNVMFKKTRESDLQRSRNLARQIHVNPLVAWAKQNDISLKDVGSVKAI